MQSTYGLKLKDLFRAEDLAFGTYRFSVGELIPEMTKVAWQSKRSDIQKLSPGMTSARFRYQLPRKKYEAEWGKQYEQPGVGARFLAFLFRLMPRFGPFKVLAFKPVLLKARRCSCKASSKPCRIIGCC